MKMHNYRLGILTWLLLCGIAHEGFSAHAQSLVWTDERAGVPNEHVTRSDGSFLQVSHFPASLHTFRVHIEGVGSDKVAVAFECTAQGYAGVQTGRLGQKCPADRNRSEYITGFNIYLVGEDAEKYQLRYSCLLVNHNKSNGTHDPFPLINLEGGVWCADRKEDALRRRWLTTLSIQLLKVR
jgi:hypothetical protein